MDRTLTEFEDIISFEVARAGSIPGHDPEDVAQELREFVFAKCLPKLNDENT